MEKESGGLELPGIVLALGVFAQMMLPDWFVRLSNELAAYTDGRLVTIGC